MKKLNIERLKGNPFKIMLFIAAILLNVIFIHESFAEVYKYVGKNGTVCFTDDLRSVPVEYREKAIIISEQVKKEESRQSAGRSEENKGTDSTAGSIEKKEDAKENIKGVIKGFISSRVFKIIVGIICFLFAFIIVGKISSSMGYRQIGTILRIGLTLLALLYIFNSYLQEVVNAFTTLKQDVLGVKKQAEEREQKVNKSVNELFQEPAKANK